MKNKIILLFVIVLFILTLAYNFWTNNDNNEQKAVARTLKIREIALNVEVADEEMEREKGLSGRKNLAKDEGMLFVFEKEGYYGIWMKDMNFPIDIAWLDQDKKIVHTEENILPETFPKIFGSQIQSSYVLETNAGIFENASVGVGDLAEF